MIIGKAITAGGSGGSSYVMDTIPERFKRLEYIESTGTQLINTGCSPKSNTKVVIELTPLASGMAENAIFGSTWSANGFFLMFYQNKLRWHSKGASVDISNFNANGKNEIVCTPTSITVNGTSYSLSGTGADSTNPITLFYAGEYSEAKYGIYRLHSCKIFEGDSLIRDYIPVLDEADVPCLYDKVTKEYFYKQGNGEFAFEESPKPPVQEGSEIVCTLIVSTAEGALVKATLEKTEVSGTANEDGEIAFALGKEGLWTISATYDGETISTEVLVEHNVEESLTFFPEEPSSYEQLALITSSQTWTAPENGYFQIEVFGASGNGGGGKYGPYFYSGGGGGGGGYSASRISLNKGDTIALTVGAVGSITKAVVNSSHNNSYDHTLQVTSGANGTSGSSMMGVGRGGAGGTASGGNYANNNGGTGGNGSVNTDMAPAGGAGGAAGYTGGNVGGQGAAGNVDAQGSPGSAGFVKIYRGNTN